MKWLWMILTIVPGFLHSQNIQWKAPDSSNSIKNPVTSTTDVITKGKKLYALNCAVCHGNNGKGDGVGGVALDPKPANFTKPNFTQQTDGAIFWKIKKGRAPMAAYNGILKDEEIWQLIHYLRDLSKTSKR